jgi:hypothetical protein
VAILTISVNPLPGDRSKVIVHSYGVDERHIVIDFETRAGGAADLRTDPSRGVEGGACAKNPLRELSAEAKVHLVDLPIDCSSGDRIKGKGFVEHFRRGSYNEVKDTQYQLFSNRQVASGKHSRHADADGKHKKSHLCARPACSNYRKREFIHWALYNRVSGRAAFLPFCGQRREKANCGAPFDRSCNWMHVVGK